MHPAAPARGPRGSAPANLPAALAPTRPCCRGPCRQGDRAAPACARCSPSRQGTHDRPVPSPRASSTQPRMSGPCCRKLSTEGHVSRAVCGHVPQTAHLGPGHSCSTLRAAERGRGPGSVGRRARLALNLLLPGFTTIILSQKKLTSSKSISFCSSTVQKIEQNWGKLRGGLQCRPQMQLGSV